MRWRVKCTLTGTVLASGFKSLEETNAWHDIWCDSFEDDDTRPGCTFEKYDPIAGLVITVSTPETTCVC